MHCSRAERFRLAAAEQGGGAIIKTTVDYALMRGLATAGPVTRRGASSVWRPASEDIRLLVESRVLLAVTRPPALLSFGMDVLWAMTSFLDVRH